MSKIRDLPLADTLTGEEKVVLVQGGGTKQGRLSDLVGRSATGTGGYAYAIADRDPDGQRIAVQVAEDGTFEAARARVETINGVRPENAVLKQEPFAGKYHAHVIYCGTEGQSLGAGHSGGGNITTRAIPRAFMYPFNVSNPAPDGFKPSLATDLSLTTPDGNGTRVAIRDGEFPGFGSQDFFQELIAKENGIAPASTGMMLVGGNNARGATGILGMMRGSLPYDQSLQQISALKAWSTANGRPLVAFGAGWYQGESDAAMTEGVYRGHLQLRARHKADDVRAILTGADDVTADQTFDPHLVTFASCSKQPGAPGSAANLYSVARAQLRAALDYHYSVIPAGHAKPAPVGFLCPTHFMAYTFDRIHVPAEWAYVLGAYLALYNKRVFFDEWDPATPHHRRFPPIHPVKVRRIGNSLLIKYQRRAPGTRLRFAVSAEIDGTGIPEQENYGFGVYDTGAGALLPTLLDPVWEGPDELRLQLSAGTWTDGLRVGYAIGDHPASRLGLYDGAAGNVADDYGRLVQSDRVGFELNNWLSPHFIQLAAGSWSLN